MDSPSFFIHPLSILFIRSLRKSSKDMKNENEKGNARRGFMMSKSLDVLVRLFSIEKEGVGEGNGGGLEGGVYRYLR